MKALHTLLPLIIAPTFFLANINQLQAEEVYYEGAEQGESFTFDRAVWRNRRDLLVLRGTGTPGATIDAFIAGTDQHLGTNTVNSRGYWSFKFYGPTSVPCGVRAVNGSFVQERAVSKAPADCISAADTPPDDPTPPENSAPVISGSPDTSVAEGQTYRFAPSASDADGDSLTFAIANRPVWASFNASTGVLSGTPDYNAAGTTSDIRISVSDGSATASLNAFSITVNDTNRAPTISGSPGTSAAENQAYHFAPSASDADGDSLTFSIVNRPAWASFNPSTGALSGTPDYNSAGTTSDIRISVSDGSATASLNAFSITVNDTNRTPTISGTPGTSVAENQAYRFAPSASDADGDSLTFSIANRPAWASFNPSTGVLSGTPDYNSAGTTSDIRISVSDGRAMASLNAFSITVSDTNRAPTISGTPGTSVAENQAYRFTPSANDADGDSLSFTIANKPAWASFDASTGVLSGTPDYSSAGTTSDIRISVSDGNATASLNAFSITVSDTNRAPTISGTPVTSIDEGSSYRFTPSANDPDGDALTYSVTGLPSWASFDNQTGTLSGTPDSNAAGTYSNIVISVSDGSSTASLAGFAITVADVTQGGTFQFTNNSYSVDEGSVLTMTISRSNSQGQATISYGTDGIEAKSREDYDGFSPVPVTFSDGERTKTVTLTTLADDITDPDETLYVYLWTPSDGYTLGTPNKVVVTIRELTNPNNAPSISGTAPNSVAAGDEYQFAPIATDEDNDTLSFSITNLPSWANFNEQTGVLNGTPSTGDAGLYENIVITVTDGIASASLSPLSIAVTDAEPTSTMGSVSLAWNPPTTRTDGSALDMSEIGGYIIYMGSTADNLEQVVDLADSTISDHVVDNLVTGDYYFAVTTYDTAGNESSYSNVVMKSAM